MNPHRDSGIPAPNHALVMQELPGLLAPGDLSEFHWDGWRGFYINLDRSTDRRAQMEQQLAGPGFAGCYQRFSAITAGAEEAQSLGLRTAGELGVWRSTLALLDQIAEEASERPVFWHVIEDDVELHPMLPIWLERLAKQASQDWDILFTDSYVLSPIYQEGLSICRQRQSIEALSLIRSPYYLAGATSYLISSRSFDKVRRALRSFLRAITPLKPLDIAIRKLAENGELNIAVCLPYLSRPRLSLGSTIQHSSTTREKIRQRSVNGDLFLRRLLYVDAFASGCQSDLAGFWGYLSSDFSSDEQQELVALVLELMLARGYKVLY